MCVRGQRSVANERGWDAASMTIVACPTAAPCNARVQEPMQPLRRLAAFLALVLAAVKALSATSAWSRGSSTYHCPHCQCQSVQVCLARSYSIAAFSNAISVGRQKASCDSRGEGRSTQQRSRQAESNQRARAIIDTLSVLGSSNDSWARAFHNDEGRKKSQEVCRNTAGAAEFLAPRSASQVSATQIVDLNASWLVLLEHCACLCTDVRDALFPLGAGHCSLHRSRRLLEWCSL